MSPPEPPADPPPVSRRVFMMLTGIAVAASATAVDLVATSESAAAAVTWGHPFSYRQAAGSRFGMRRGTMHQGQDYPAGLGTAIYAVADGTVANRGVLGTQGAYGNAVFVTHADGWSSRYAHMKAPSGLSVGQAVSRGALIGYVGNTGRSRGAHLHLELRKNGRAVDPYNYVHNAPLAGTAAAPAAPVPAPTAPQENDMTYSISVDGHYYAVAPQFISHHDTIGQATVTRNVVSATDEFHVLSSTQFTELLDGLGIPREVVQPGAVLDPQAGSHRSNGTWSRDREILAALSRLGG